MENKFNEKQKDYVTENMVHLNNEEAENRENGEQAKAEHSSESNYPMGEETKLYRRIHRERSDSK